VTWWKETAILNTEKSFGSVRITEYKDLFWHPDNIFMNAYEVRIIRRDMYLLPGGLLA
jgi:hypothetical protein